VTSNVDIANRALTKLGAARIISLEDRKKEAETINSMFDAVRDAELRDHVWSFARARASLPAMSEAPGFGYRLQYQLPSDHLRLLRIANFRVYPKPRESGLYSIEGRRILTDIEAPLQIEYSTRVIDPNLFDALFVEVVACSLAVESCEALTQSQTKFQQVASMYGRAVAAAIRANAVERPTQAINDDTWLESRR